MGGKAVLYVGLGAVLLSGLAVGGALLYEKSRKPAPVGSVTVLPVVTVPVTQPDVRVGQGGATIPALPSPGQTIAVGEPFTPSGSKPDIMPPPLDVQKMIEAAQADGRVFTTMPVPRPADVAQVMLTDAGPVAMGPAYSAVVPNYTVPVLQAGQLLANIGPSIAPYVPPPVAPVLSPELTLVQNQLRDARIAAGTPFPWDMVPGNTTPFTPAGSKPFSNTIGTGISQLLTSQPWTPAYVEPRLTRGEMRAERDFL